MTVDIIRDKKSEKYRRKREFAAKKRAEKEAEIRERARNKADKRDAELRRKAQLAASKKERDELAAKQKAARRRERKQAYAEKVKLAEQRRKKRLAVYAKIRSKLTNIRAGFDYDNFGWLPRVELAVGGDRTTVATRLSAAGIAVADIRACDGQTLVKIRKKDMRKAVAILDEMCYTHKINATYGVGRRCSFFGARFGLIVGAVAATLGMNIAYGYVWRIGIYGNDSLSSAAIEATLRQAGVVAGCKKSDEVVIRAAAALGAMDGVADASCEMIGTTLYVHVLEAKDYTVVRSFGEYKSAYDATVTRISVRDGTACVARGDVVKSGQTLVTGDVFSTSGELLYSGDCDAEVYGNVAVTYSAQIPAVAVEYRRTGRSRTSTVARLFGASIGKASCPYASYDMTAHTSRYDVLIPLYVTAYTYYETEPIEYTRDIDAAAREYAESVVNGMEFVGEFTSSYNITESAAGMYTVHLFLSGEALISRGTARTSPIEQQKKISETK